jgi:CubicO group peptidase (beta-lactamase class C family)
MCAERAAPEVVPVTGFAKEPFAPLADVFARLVGAQGRGGAALAIYHNGGLVVDLVGGDYRQDSLQLLFSVTKPITAIASAMAHAAGLIDLDAPLADYWPAFDRPSTAVISARSVLGHRSGLAALDERLSLQQLLDAVDEDAIETQEPYWVPDTAHGYHGFTFGTLLNGAFRRTVGKTVGEYVDEHVAKRLGLDLWIGAPEDQLARIERIHYDSPKLTPGRVEHLRESRIPLSTTSQLAQQSDLYNDPSMARACWPSSSGVAGARDLARLLYATLHDVDGDRLLTEDETRAMLATRSNGLDRVLGVISHFGSGVQRPFPQLPLLGANSFGHEAAGGSAAVADPERDIAVGYTTNIYPSMNGASVGFLALMPAIQHCLTERADDASVVGA